MNQTNQPAAPPNRGLTITSAFSFSFVRCVLAGYDSLPEWKRRHVAVWGRLVPTASDVPGQPRNPGDIGVAQPLPSHSPALLLHQRYTERQYQPKRTHADLT